MNLRSKFSKKPWQHKDAEHRAAAVRESRDSELTAQLPQLAQHDDSPAVRLAALERLNTEPFWLDARLRESDPGILVAADRFLSRAALISDDERLESARLEWLDQIDDGDLVRKFAAEAQSIALRRSALARIKSQGFLGDCYIRETDDELAGSILSRIDQTSTLERIASALRTQNKQRARAASEALETRLSASGKAEAGHAASERLVREAEKLARGEFTGDAEQLIKDLREKWQSGATHPERLSHRFESAIQIADSARKGPAPVTHNAEPEADSAADPDGDAVNPGLLAAADQIRTMVGKDKNSADPGELLANWDRAWNQIPGLSPADEQLKNDLLPMLRKLQGQVQQAKSHKAGKTEPEADEPEDNPSAEFDPRLDQIAQTLESGDIRKAHELIQDLRRDYDRLPKRNRPAAAGGRLQRMEGRLKEMRNWQHWSNNQLRDELIQQIEALPQSGQHPDAITAALKKARTEWRRLEALELLPGDKRKFAAPSGQWRRFQTACKAAFEAAKPYFEKREQVQQDNLETLNAFIAAGKQAATNPNADSGDLLGFMRKARQAIRRMDDLPPKFRGSSAASLRELMDELSKRLDELFDQVESTKRRLVTEAKALAHEKDLKAAIDKAKALQQQWQSAGSGRRKVEQQLWREFRQPIDPLFEKLKGEQKERQAADQQVMAELEALCSEAESLADAPTDALESARKRFSGLIQQWLAQDSRPPRLNQRIERAEKKLDERLAEFNRRQRAQQDDKLWRLAEAVQSAWKQRCDGVAGSLSTDETPAAQDDPAVELLRQRLDLIAQENFDPGQFEALAAEGLKEARHIAVEMEFLSGLDSPKEDQRLRMDYQVQRLAKRMGERHHQPDLASEAAELQARWFKSLPHPPQNHEDLKKRFRRAQEIIDSMIGAG